jgi:hypothetical protein
MTVATWQTAAMTVHGSGAAHRRGARRVHAARIDMSALPQAGRSSRAGALRPAR